MTDLQNHIASVASRPRDKVAALALVDHFQEAYGYSRWIALRKVACVRKPRREDNFLARAARVMRSRSLERLELDELIEDTAGLASVSSYYVLLVRGFRPPGLFPPPDDLNVPMGPEGTVLVGARWVTFHYRQIVRKGRYQAMAERHQRRHK